MLNRLFGLLMCLGFLSAVLAQAYIPFPDVQVYFAECGFLALWVLFDAIDRKAGFVETLSNATCCLLLAPLAVPRWYANRPLKHGEWRKGGVDSNFFNAFAIVTVGFTGVSAACNFLSFGPDRGFELIINSGFCVAGTALVMGLAARKERVMEKGTKRLPKNAEGEVE